MQVLYCNIFFFASGSFIRSCCPACVPAHLECRKNGPAAESRRIRKTASDRTSAVHDPLAGMVSSLLRDHPVFMFHQGEGIGRTRQRRLPRKRNAWSSPPAQRTVWWQSRQYSLWVVIGDFPGRGTPHPGNAKRLLRGYPGDCKFLRQAAA